MMCRCRRRRLRHRPRRRHHDHHRRRLCVANNQCWLNGDCCKVGFLSVCLFFLPLALEVSQIAARFQIAVYIKKYVIFLD